MEQRLGCRARSLPDFPLMFAIPTGAAYTEGIDGSALVGLRLHAELPAGLAPRAWAAIAQSS